MKSHAFAVSLVLFSAAAHADPVTVINNGVWSVEETTLAKRNQRLE